MQEGKSSHPADNKPSSGFTNVYHNNESFHVTFIKDYTAQRIKSSKSCISCNIDFQRRNAVCPNDMCLRHSERWQYKRKKADGSSDLESSQKLTTKFVCCKLACVRKRYPYFWNEYITISPETNEKLQASHKLHLQKEFNFRWGCEKYM